MAQKISVGIDIGSSTIKVMVVESVGTDPKAKPRVIGIGYAEAEGIKNGYIINSEEASKSLRRAIYEAQKTSGYKIDKAYFSICSAGLEGMINNTTVSLGTKETTVSGSDIEQAIEQCQNELKEEEIRNREILHAIPLGFKIDGKQIFGKPQGMVGLTLEVKVFFITALSQHLGNLLETAKLSNIEIEDIIASPVASSITLLSKSQQVAGCGLLTIGSETVSLGVFENGVPICIEVIPLGSRDITNDIALGFKKLRESKNLAQRVYLTQDVKLKKWLRLDLRIFVTLHKQH
jgi:cell division protein FtsA